MPSSSGDRPGQERPIRREDIEARLRAVQSEITNVKDSTVGVGIAAGGALALALLIVAFLVGKRIGARRYSFVEVRRF